MKKLLAKLLSGIVLFSVGAPAYGLNIVPTFDSSIVNDPNGAAMMTAINAAIQDIQSNIADAGVVKILFTNDVSVSLGASTTWYNVYTYSAYLTALKNRATSSFDTNALSKLPNSVTDPVIGGTQIRIVTALARHMGLNTTYGPDGFDSTISLNMPLMNFTRPPGNSSKYDLQQVVEHEIDEVLGTSSSLPTLTPIRPIDLFRYTTNLSRTFTVNGDNAYFSVDGTNLLARFNMNSGGDYSDWWSATAHWAPPGTTARPQIQDAFNTPGVVIDYGVNELAMLDVLGWTLTDNANAALNPPTIVITAPSLNAVLTGSAVQTVSGTADDNTAPVGQVLVALKRNSDGAWYNFVGQNLDGPALNSNRDLLPATGTTNWSAQLPAMANGNYTVQAEAMDVYGHASLWKSVIFTLAVSAPVVAFNPLTNTATVFDFAQIGGTINSAATVTFRIQQYDAGGNNDLYWNGTAFTASSVYLAANVSGGVWTPNVTLPARGQTRYGPYFLRVAAVDAGGNASTNEILVTRSATDTTPPVVTLDNIRNGDVFTNAYLPGLSGLTLDYESGIASVNVYLNRFTSGGVLYWNGSTWTSNPAVLTASYNPQTVVWQVNQPLPSGANLPNASYQVQVSVQNNEAPTGSTLLSVNFSVDYHPRYLFTAGSYYDNIPNNENMRWDNPANWDVGSVPPADSVVVINSQSPDNTALGSVPLYRLDMSGGTLTTSGMLIQKLNLSGGNLTGGVITIATNGIFNWSGGAISGTCNIPGGVPLNLTGAEDKYLTPNTTLNLAGSATWAGTGNLTAGYGVTLNNTGSFSIQSDSQFYNYTAGVPVPVFNNDGVVQKTNAAGVTVISSANGGWVFNNNGTLDIGSGVLSSQNLFYLNNGSLLSGAGVFRVNASTMVFNGTNTLQAGATFELAGGTLTGTNTFAGTGTFIWSGGSISAALTLQTNIALTISGGDKTLSPNSTVTTAGNVTWTEGGTVNVGYGSVFKNDGSFVAQNDAQFYNYTAGAPVPRFINNGSFTKTNSAGTSTFNSANGGVAFDNNGSFSVQSGNLIFGGGGNNVNGIFIMAPASRIDLTGGAFFCNGIQIFSGFGTNRVNGASVTFSNGTNALQSGATFELVNGTLTGTNTFAGTGAFVWSGGTISAALTLQTNIALTISGGDKTLSPNSTVTTAGNVTWTEAGMVNVGYGSVFKNNGSFVAQNDAQFYNYTAGAPVPRFINNGSFTKTNSAGTSTFNSANGGVAFDNNGSVLVQSGSLTLGGGGNCLNDSFTAGAGSVIAFQGGAFFCNGNQSLLGGGTNLLSGAALTFNNGTNMLGGANTFEINSGSVSGTNIFTGAGTVGWSGGSIDATLNLQTNIVLNISGDYSKTLAPGGNFTLAGSTRWKDGGDISVGSSTAIYNNGVFTARSGAQFYNYTAGAPVPVFVNNGTFTKSGAAGTSVLNSANGGVAFNNNGTVTLQAGDLILGGGGSGTNGIFTTAAGSHLDLTGGGFNWSGNSTINGAGVTRVYGAMLNFGGTTKLDGNFEVASGTAAGTNTFTGAGTFNWTSGNIAGNFTLQSNLNFNIAIAGDKTLQPNSTINNAGTATWSGTGNLNMGYGSAINNSGTFTIQNDMAFYNFTSGAPAPVFNNTGLLRKSVATGETTFHPSNGGVNFNNSGTVDLRSGILLVWAGYATSPAAQFKIPLGGVTANTQYGVEYFNSPAIFDGTLTVTLTNNFMPTNGDSFILATYGSHTGEFAATQLPPLPSSLQWKLSYTAGELLLQVVPGNVFQSTSLVNGNFQFTFSGETGSRCLIEVSTNLNDWLPRFTNAPFNGTLNFVDLQTAQFPRQFYRATIFP